MLTATSTFAHASTKRPRVPFTQSFKAASGFGFLALALYEAAAPALQIEPTNPTGLIVAGCGAVFGLLIARWA